MEEFKILFRVLWYFHKWLFRCSVKLYVGGYSLMLVSHDKTQNIEIFSDTFLTLLPCFFNFLLILHVSEIKFSFGLFLTFLLFFTFFSAFTLFLIFNSFDIAIMAKYFHQVDTLLCSRIGLGVWNYRGWLFVLLWSLKFGLNDFVSTTNFKMDNSRCGPLNSTEETSCGPHNYGLDLSHY